MPKLRIEEAAARTQARIDSGRQPVIGVNKYRLTEPENIEVLKVDNAAVRAGQIAKLDAAAGRTRRGRLPASAAELTRAAATGRPGPGEQPARAGDRRGAGEGHRRRDLATRSRRSAADTGADPYDHRRVPARRPATVGAIEEMRNGR